MKKILTIVVPTYNMEKYLDKCLTSLVIDDKELLKQVEVLVIIDGATDRSSEMAHTYQDRYPDTFRVIDKENGNYGSCVNRGLKEATGKYIKILDADDWFDTQVFDRYLGSLRNVDADLVITEFITFDSNNHILNSSVYNLPINQVFDFCDFPCDKNLEMHTITYRSDILKNIKYVQTEGVFYTDTEWATKPLYHIKTCVYYPFYLYAYLLGREGQTSDFDIAFNRYNDYLVTFRNIIEYSNEQESNGNNVPFVIEKIKRVVAIPYQLVIQRYGAENSWALETFDEFLKNSASSLYDYLDTLTVLYEHVPMKYVHVWRKGSVVGKLSVVYVRVINKLISVILLLVK